MSGNVGIGTTSPSATLVVSNGGAAGIELQPEQTTDTNRILNYDRATATYMDLRIDANAHQFMISGTERMRITSAGNVTSPSRKLDVRDTSNSQATILAYNKGGAFTGTVYEAITDRTASSAFNLMNLKASTVSKFLVRGDGNVGIGTSSPAYPLEVESSGGNAYVFSENTAAGGASGFKWKTPDSEFSWYSSGGTNNMNLYDYTAASRKLHVNGDVQVDTNLVVNSGIYNTTYYAGSSTATYFKNSASADTLSILESGNVGIGLTNNDTYINSYYNVYIATGTTTNSSASNIRLFVNSTGNIGIGTTTPRAKLEVVGDVTIQNGVYTYTAAGFASGATLLNFDINVGSEAGNGNVFKIEAGFAHYYAMTYNSIAEWWCTSRATNVVNTYILNANTAFGGDWSASKPNNTTLRVTKTAGSYGGGGKYWVKVTYVAY
jgi:hypothetical protein